MKIYTLTNGMRLVNMSQFDYVFDDGTKVSRPTQILLTTISKRGDVDIVADGKVQIIELISAPTDQGLQLVKKAEKDDFYILTDLKTVEVYRNKRVIRIHETGFVDALTRKACSTVFKGFTR